MNRRTFLPLAFCDAVACLATARPGLRAWGSAKRRLSKIGLQLYTVRRELEKDFAGTLERVAALGFREVEFAGYFNHTPREIKGLLTRYQLSAPSAHLSTAELRGNLQQAIEAAQARSPEVFCSLPGALSPRSRQGHGLNTGTFLHRSGAGHD